VLCLLVPAAYADDKGDVATAQGVARHGSP
jgi:hypothetical protein